MADLDGSADSRTSASLSASSGAKSKRPIDRIRDSAGSMEIGTDDSTPIAGMLTFAQRLLVVKGSSIHEVMLADQVDPGRTNPNVPNSQKCVMRYGSDSEFVSRTLLTSDVLLDQTHLREGIDRDESMARVFAMASRFAQMKDLIAEYITRESAAVEALKKSHDRMARERAFSIPEIPNLDTLCMSFFMHAKHALQDLLDLAVCFYGGRLAKGFFSNLEDLLKEKHGEHDAFYLFLRETEFLREFVRSLRNCIEHPKPDARVIFSNLRLNEEASVVLPTFQMIHAKYPMEEVGLSILLEKMFSNLIEFAEVFIAHMVERNIKGEFAGCPVLLLRHDDGVRNNKNVHYGYGIKMNGEIMPIG